MTSCGGKGPVSKTAARPTDNQCSSVGRTQLSDTGVGDELIVVGQVTRGVAGEVPVDGSRNLEHDALPHRKLVQRTSSRVSRLCQSRRSRYFESRSQDVLKLEYWSLGLGTPSLRLGLALNHVLDKLNSSSSWVTTDDLLRSRRKFRFTHSLTHSLLRLTS